MRGGSAVLQLEGVPDDAGTVGLHHVSVVHTSSGTTTVRTGGRLT